MAEGPDCCGASVLSARGPTRPQGSRTHADLQAPERACLQPEQRPGSAETGDEGEARGWGRPLLPQARHCFHAVLRLRPRHHDVSFPVFLSLPCGKNSLKGF